MKKKFLSKKRLYLTFFASLIIVLASFFTYSLVTGSFSLATTSGWDGVSVASTFSGGNGEIDNPYQISSAEEFMHFKELIESNSFSSFRDSNFILTDDIDLGNNSITPIGVLEDEQERIFQGSFDGNGYSINNFKIVSPSIFGEKKYYSLFSKILNAEIKNLNINNFSIKSNSSYASVLVGEIETSSNDKDGEDENNNELILSSISNISISDFFVEVSDNDDDSDNNNLGVISSYASNDVLIKNVYVKGTFKNDNNYNIIIVPKNVNISNVLFDVIYSGTLLNDDNSLYLVNGGKIYLNDEEISSNSLLSLFNENNNGDYSWIIENDKYFYRKNISSIADIATENTMMFALSSNVEAIPVFDSGLSDDSSTIYINDLESDMNYYTGLNYIDYRKSSSNPNNFGQNMNIYNSSNLVEVHIKYDGHSANDDNIYGTVSVTEKTINFVYYKYYVVENGYLEIELIDNPYANRPNNRYFNGWVTDYVGAEIHFRVEDYVRYVRIPVSDTSEAINIVFHASWTEHGTTELTSAYDNGIKDFPAAGFIELEQKLVYVREDTDGLYTMGQINAGGRYPAGVYDKNGEIRSNRCNVSNQANDYCRYYKPLTSFYNDSNDLIIEDFYELQDGLMTKVELETEYITFRHDYMVAGYYKKHTSGSSGSGNYYDKDGKVKTSTCTNSNPCYELLQYYDHDGNINVNIENDKLYMRVTRDTNIMVLDKNLEKTINSSKPFTLTGINNGKTVCSTCYVNLSSNYIKNNGDFRIEFVKMSSGSSSGLSSVFDTPGENDTSSKNLYGNWYNLKVGRGITRYSSNYYTARYLYAGGRSGSYGKKRMIIESGYYDFASYTNASNSTVNVNLTAIWGSDYDRVSNPSSNSLEIKHSVVNSLTSRINSADKNEPAVRTYIKSGKIGAGAYYSSGIYIGNRSSGYSGNAAELTLEGGTVYNIIGGLNTAETTNPTASVNDVDTYIFVKGGVVNDIFGGASQVESDGSKVISITGGKIKFAVFGGSNGVGASSKNQGRVKGNSYIYIGGNAIIGDESSSATDTQSSVERGSVFGQGNGKSSDTTIGAMNNSNIIIDGNATILKNVYGGSNYGTTGISNSTTAHIIIKSGTIKGSIFGSGNNNGAGTSNVESHNIIDVYGGSIGNIYGGPNCPDSTGTDYGDVLINIYGGNISGSIYGGGYGKNTTIRDNVSINIGTSEESSTEITGNVYGGSALGKTNSSGTNVKTNVVVYGGTIKGSVFGGAMGSSSYTPAVSGDISVVVNGGSVGNVYGGFDAKGSPSKNDTVVINGGVIDNVFGGGNKTGQTSSNVTINNGTIKNSVFGGSNESGNVTDALVKVFGGTMDSVYGGGSKVGVTNATVNYNSATASNVFGGAYSAGTVKASKVYINSGNITESVFGGNNAGGATLNSYVEINNGNIGNVYGGGNVVKSGPSNVVINNGMIGDVFGGGNKAGIYAVKSTGENLSDNLADSTINITGGTINRVFGGSNNEGDIKTSNITVNTNSLSSEMNSINSNVSINKSAMQDWQKSQYPQYKTMKTYAFVQIQIQNNSNTVFKNLGLILNYSDSVILNTYDVSKTNLKHSQITKNSVLSKYNDGSLDLNGYGYIGIQFEIFSSVTPDEFNLTADLIDLSSSINELYGGNNAGGTVTNTKINASNASIFYIYGGGNNAPVISSNVKLTNVTGFNAFGGNNVSKSTSASEIEVNTSKFVNVYGGGNNAINGGSAVTVNSGNYTNVFGGGNAAESGSSNVTINNGNIVNVFGGGNSAGLSNDTAKLNSTLNVKGGKITNIYGGSNEKGILNKSEIIVDIDSSQVSTGTPYSDKIKLDINYSKSDVDPSILEANQDNEDYEDIVSYAKVKVTVTNLFTSPIDEWDLLFNIPESLVYANNSDVTVKEDSTSNNLIRASSISKSGDGSHHLLPVGGSYTFEFEVVSSTSTRNLSVMGEVTNPNDVYIMTDNFNIINVYGGGNKGNDKGHVSNAFVTTKSGRIVNVYGGGNAATINDSNVTIGNTSIVNIYGGGNMASTKGSTILKISNSTIYANVYGGGNQGPVTTDTSVRITNSAINGNAFAGGNGSAAIVNKKSTITIDGNTIIGTEKSIAPNSGCVFGGGNAANNGVEANPALGTKESIGTSVVNLVGGLVYGNVYGGAKMAIIYGNALTKIGTKAVANNSLVEGNIRVVGSIFGGGESNVSGNSSYDANAISVTNGIDVQINGENYVKNEHDFIINGSIFGSGNASNSSGTSVVYIKNLGTKDKPNQALSIQRTKDLTIDSSVIELSGAKDKTNEALRFQYSFNLIDSLKLVNNSTLLLKRNANVLKTIYSGLYVNGNLEPAVVDIDDSTKKVTKNVDNRIYMFTPQVLNVSTRPDANGGYGKITGMTFFGMYTGGSNGYNYGVYDSKYSYGDKGNGDLVIAGGSYIKGLHLEDHDITKDGFYTNYLDEDTYSNITTAYIDPIDIGNNGYQWIIGYPTDTYEVYLTAAKFSSLGTYSLGMDGFYKGNTTFTVLGFDSTSMKSGVNIVDYADVPRVAKTEKEANNTFGLVMKAETQEWTGHGVTKYMGNSYEGDNIYLTDTKTGTPSLMFYLYHARNIDSDEDLGSCTITMQASIPKNAIENEIRYINIVIYIDSSNKDDVEGYDASIAYDKKYELPRFTDVNITNKSQFSAYFSLAEFYDSFEKVYGKNNDCYHVITTDRPLPVDTMVTMIDLSANHNRPEYYYLRITEEMYNESIDKLNKKGEVDYRLSDFIKMDSVSPDNRYNDKEANLLYYDEEAQIADEEFIFIFDFKDTNVMGSYVNNYLLFELRGADDFRRLGVGKNNDIMYYSTYDNSNVALAQNFSNNPNYLYYDIPFNFEYSTAVLYDQTGSGETVVSIIDTNYESSSMGINVSFIDKEGETVSSSLLVGTSLIIDNKEYFADGDGVFRIKLTDKVSSVLKDFKIVVNKDLPSGDYKLRYTLFASDDGLHNSNTNKSVTSEFDIHVVSSDNYISVDCDDKDKIVDGETGLNLNGTNINNYSIKFSSTLSNPNFRIYVYKRKIDSVDSNEFVNIPFNDLFKNKFNSVNKGVYINLQEYRINKLDLELNDNLTSGTYKISFEMYDKNQLIDQDIKYVIVKKKVE